MSPRSPSAPFDLLHHGERQLPLEKLLFFDETEERPRNSVCMPLDGVRLSVIESTGMVKKRLTAEDHVRESWLSKGLPVLSAEAKKKLRASPKMYQEREIDL
eukprot:GEMP01093283.1.p2 GENE.GEMP01093283.1~~GEMP01093283.1.p2  ORF type:complete len:102 (+),score=28.04 GEMP01093283.1:189-494(+)